MIKLYLLNAFFNCEHDSQAKTWPRILAYSLGIKRRINCHLDFQKRFPATILQKTRKILPPRRQCIYGGASSW